MKKFISILIITFSIVVAISSCTSSDSPSEKRTDTTAIQQDMTQVVDAKKERSEENKLSGYFLYASLGLNIICIILIIIAFKRLSNLDYQIQIKRSNNNSEASKRTMESYPSYNPKREIEDALSRFRFPESEINRIEGIIYNRLNNHFQKQHENVGIQSTSNNVQPSNGRFILYASQCHKDNNTFYNVTESPNGGTVYELEVIGTQAEFVLYSGAIKKVIEAPDFLVSASDLQIKDNHSTARTDTKGKATQKSDGSWTVDTKARIIFE